MVRSFLPGIQAHFGEDFSSLRFDLARDLREISPEVFPRPTPFVISSVSADRLEDPKITEKVRDLKLAKKRVPAPVWNPYQLRTPNLFGVSLA